MFHPLCVLFYLSVAFSQPVSYRPTPAPYIHTATALGFNPIPPIAARVFPFSPTPKPLLPGHNNPYYNPIAIPAVPILTYSNNHGVDGTYSFSFTTGDGKQVQENGYLKDAYIDNSGEPQGIQVVQGSYGYIAPDGTLVQVAYVADENGFRPSSVHIPSDGKTVPPVVVDGKNNKKTDDPAYNQSNSLRYLNRINNYSQHNYFPRPYDFQYTYDPIKYNPYKTHRFSGYNNGAKTEPKKVYA